MCIKLVSNFVYLCVSFCLIYNFANGAPQYLEHKIDLCTTPFTLIGKNCYFIGVSDKLNCHDAAKECVKLDAELTKIENGQDMQAINDFLISLYGIKSADEQKFWIAGNDLHYRGYFFWQFPFARMNYTKWADGRPNSAHTMSENCVQLVYEKDAYYMYDKASIAHSHYICEKSKPKLHLNSKQDTTPTSCPAGFTRIGAKCYFIEQHEELDLLNARIKCSQLNAKIADIQNIQEKEALNKYLTSLNERNEYRVLVKSFQDLQKEKYALGNATYDNCVQLFYMDGEYGIAKCACREKMRYICEIKAQAISTNTSAITVAEANRNSVPCPGLFVALLDKCYFVEDYMSLDQRSAENYCQQIGGQLSKIESEYQFAVLIKYLKETSPPMRKLWIAGTKQHNVTDFAWHNANAKVSYTKWASGEPKDKLGTERCIKLLYADDKDEYYMHSADCRDAIFFVCDTTVQTEHGTGLAGKATKTTEPTVRQCPQEFELVGEKCYYFEKTLKSNWHNARTACFNMGVDLLRIRNKHEENTLYKYLKYMNTMQTFWIASIWNNDGIKDENFDSNCRRLVPLNGAYQVNRNSCLYNDYFICESTLIGEEQASIANTVTSLTTTNPKKSIQTFLLKEANLNQNLWISGSSGGMDIQLICFICVILNTFYSTYIM